MKKNDMNIKYNAIYALLLLSEFHSRARNPKNAFD